MMSNDTAELEFGFCGCCLEQGEHRNLANVYYVGEQPEIYQAFIKDTFNIEMNYPESTKLICDICLVELKQAKHFKSMMQSSQQTLRERANLRTQIVDDIHISPCVVKVKKSKPENNTNNKITAEVVDWFKDGDILVTENLVNVKMNINWPPCDDSGDSGVNENEAHTSGYTNVYATPCVVKIKSSIDDIKKIDAEVVDWFIDRDTIDGEEFVNVVLEVNCEARDYDGAEELHELDVNNNQSPDQDSNVEEEGSQTEDLVTVASRLQESIQQEVVNCERDSYVEEVERQPVISHFKKSVLQNHITHESISLLEDVESPAEELGTADQSDVQEHISHESIIVIEDVESEVEDLGTADPTDPVALQDKLKPLKVLITRSPSIEKLVSEHQYKQTKKKTPLCCNHCQYSTNSKPSFTKHMSTHIKKQYLCDLCPYKSSYKKNLFAHMRIHTGQGTLNCDFCPYTTESKLRLSRHLVTHTQKFLCDKCPYKSSYKKNLVAHISIHTGERPFHCKLCPYKAKRKNALKMHMATHAGGLYSCRICRYKTNHKYMLKSHLYMHSNPKPLTSGRRPFKAAKLN